MAPMPFSYLPNVITIGRIVLVLPIGLYLLREEYRPALWLVFIAGISDGLDGWLARVGNWRSRLGAGLDALADKLLLVTTFSCLWLQGLLPLWLVAVVVLRDVYLVVGGLVYHRYFERIDLLKPSRLSKWNTALQVGLALLVLAHAAWPEVGNAVGAEEMLFILNRVVLVTTVVTFADYAWTWSRKAQVVARLASYESGNAPSKQSRGAHGTR